MEADLVDGQAVKQLRTLFRLNTEQAAQLSGLTPEQFADLEQGSMSNFASPAQKIQSALRLAKTLSGEQKNGLPRVNVFKNNAIPSEVAGNALHEHSKNIENNKPRYTYRTNPLHLLLIATIIVFIFFIAAIPVMFIGNPDKLKGDIVVPRTWKVPK